MVNKSIISVTCACLAVVSFNVNAAAITSLQLTGGNFSMAGAGGTINPAAFANMSVDGVTYDGSIPASAGTETDYYATSIATFEFGFFGPVAIYTAETDGVNSGFPAVTGDITGGNLSLDLSSWTAYWSGTSFNQGSFSDMAPGSVCVGTTCSTAIATAYDAGTGGFTASWSAVVVGGPFNGQLGQWDITGNVSAVPVPAAVWLFGSGLIGLIGLARRKANA